jgi:hypothetical protein
MYTINVPAMRKVIELFDKFASKTRRYDKLKRKNSNIDRHARPLARRLQKR